MPVKRLALSLLLCACVLLPALASAQPEYQFKLGFKALADQIPDIAGQPLENEHHNPANGDALQRTTTGLMAWRKADNWTAFTNGHTTWINGPFGVQSRLNDQRFDWEAQDPGTSPAPPGPQPAQPPAQPSPQPISLAPARQVPPAASATGHPGYGVAEAYVHDASTQLGITWERLVFSWADIQPGGPGDWRADLYFPPHLIDRERSRGIEIVPVLQFTPTWAAKNPGDGHRSVPGNLSAPWNSPDNYWGQFTHRLANHYKGRIDRWIIWNEPEFKPGDRGAGHSYTWFGSDEEYYLLLKTAYRAIKAANPNATVIFGGTSYWVDINMGRVPFFKRILDIAEKDPEARNNNWFFDAVGFNIYWCPDDLLRIFVEMKQAMKAKGFDKPIWLTETNAMPYDDPATPKPQDGQRVPLQIQADYGIQSLAITSAVGYQRYGWYRMTDGQIWRDQEVWGLLRDDGSDRPIFHALKNGIRHFAGANSVYFVPLERADQPFGTPWPQDPNSYYPNWLIYQVVFDHPDGRRVTVLWNASDTPQRVRVPKKGSGATQVDKYGNERPATEASGWYVVDLGPATVRGPQDPQGYHYIGGPPVILVERGVPHNASIDEPRLGDPGSAQPALQLTLDPLAQKFTPGQSVRFTLRLRGIEGFNSQVQLSIDSLPKGLRVEMPATAYPGDRIQITVHSDPSLEPNLYILPLKATGGGITATTDLVLEVPPA